MAGTKLSLNSTWLVTSPLDTKCYLAHAFWHRETCRDVSRLSDSTARHARHDKRDRCDSHDTCSGTSPQRGLLRWTCPPHFSRSRSWDWCISRAQDTKLVHASTNAS